MPSISLLTNPIALQVQQNLRTNLSSLTTSLQRLSSGLRLNSAKDGAADLGVANQLDADRRVHTAAALNVSHAVSTIDVAAGAADELSNILERLEELSTEASSDGATSTQRQSLDNEAQLLVSEYNRILTSTEFNDTSLLDGTFTELSVQAGYGTPAQINLELGNITASGGGGVTSTDGTFQTAVSYADQTPGGNVEAQIGDVNGDGKADIVTAHQGGVGVIAEIYIGNGDGTFNRGIDFTTPSSSPNDIVLSDINGDTFLDLVYAPGGPSVGVSLGNGDGTFKAENLYNSNFLIQSITLADVNGDGIRDFLGSDLVGNVDVLLGNSNGTFKIVNSYGSIAPGSASTDQIDTGYFNGDANLDVVISFNTALFLFTGNSDGSFNAPINLGAGNFHGVDVADYDGDGDSDIAVGGSGTGSQTGIYLSNNNGTFFAPVNYESSTSGFSVETTDINNDSVLDIVSKGGATVSILFGNSGGTFKAPVNYVSGPGPLGLAVGDVNADTFEDLVGLGPSAMYVNLASVTTSGATTFTSSQTLSGIDLTTKNSAITSLDTVYAASSAIFLKKAQLGAAGSRLDAAFEVVSNLADEYDVARGRIVDVDVAVESANFLKYQILTNSDSALLGQANQIPSIALKLLSF